MCSLDFFFKPEEDSSASFFDLGEFHGSGCQGSSQERKETIRFLLGIACIAALVACALIRFTQGSLKKGQAIAARCDHLTRAIVEHDEYCAKRGIRGRAETFDTACIEGHFLDAGTLGAWLSVNNLESNIEGVEMADFADLLPKGEEFLEIEDMRRAFSNIVKTIKHTKQLPDDMNMDNIPEEAVAEQQQQQLAAGAVPSALNLADTPHQLVSARGNPSASRLKSINVTPGLLVATTPPPEPVLTAGTGTAETDKLLKKGK